MSVPHKYRAIGDFHEYYSGARKAPYLTIFIAGNHEASNHLSELFYGGWAAPNIYYMGAANIVRLGPLRIAGLSGIWKGYNYNKPHFERLPYSYNDIKSLYHVREFDTRKLLQVRTQVDVGLSHDWPRGVEWKGNWRQLFRKKKDFEADARSEQLGSVAAKYVLNHLRPPYWFSAHLHIKYPATIEHQDNTTAKALPDGAVEQEAVGEPQKNTEEIELDIDDEDTDIKPEEAKPSAMDTSGASASAAANTEEIDLGLDDNDSGPAASAVADVATADVSEDLKAQLPASFAPRPKPPKPATLPRPEDIKNKTTKFLALDKCLPHRDFLQILEIEPISTPPSETIPERPFRLEYDKEWLAITRVFAQDLVVGDPDASVPADKGDAHYRPLIEQEEAWVEENIVRPGKMVIPEDFAITAPVYKPEAGEHVKGQPKEYTNPHTKTFCEMLQIPNPFDATEEERAERMRRKYEGDEEEGSGNSGSRGGFRGGSGGGGRGRGGGRGGSGGRGGRGRGRGNSRGRGRGRGSS